MTVMERYILYTSDYYVVYSLFSYSYFIWIHIHIYLIQTQDNTLHYCHQNSLIYKQINHSYESFLMNSLRLLVPIPGLTNPSLSELAESRHDSLNELQVPCQFIISSISTNWIFKCSTEYQVSSADKRCFQEFRCVFVCMFYEDVSIYNMISKCWEL